MFRFPVRLAVALTGSLVAIGLAFASPAIAALPTDFSDQLVVGNLSQPASFAFLPDGRILIVEQKTARVRLFTGGTPDTTLTLTDVNTSGGERGLLGIAVDPGWPARPYVYLYFDQTPSVKCYIVRYTASGDLSDPVSSNLTLASRYLILTDIPDNANNHNGGTLRFGPDGKLYASLGEDADMCGAQDSTTFKGEILRLDVSSLPAGAGGPPAKSLIAPADNPFYVPGGNANANLVYAFGLRNPFRFHADPVTGSLYIGDVGQSTWEEMNECGGGENFGWPNFEGPAIFSTACPVQSAYTGPIGTINRTGLPSASIIGGPRYRRLPGGAYSFPAGYEGDVFFGEYYSGLVRRLKNTGGTWAPAPAAPGQPNANDWATSITNVSDWLTGPDGALYYCKQFSSPSIRRIVYTGLQPPGIPADLTASAMSRSRINLAWSASSGTVDSYDIESRVPPAAFAPRASVPGAQTSYPDTGLVPSTLYEYRVSARNGAGTWGYSNTASDTTLSQTGVAEGGGERAPRLAVYPNPYAPGAAGVTITFNLPAPGRVRLDLFDVTGRRVGTLLDQAMAGGSGSLTWDGSVEGGRPLSKGVYFVQLQAPGTKATTRLVLSGH